MIRYASPAASALAYAALVIAGNDARAQDSSVTCADLSASAPNVGLTSSAPRFDATPSAP